LSKIKPGEPASAHPGHNLPAWHSQRTSNGVLRMDRGRQGRVNPSWIRLPYQPLATLG